jgi:hypothetical protein
MLPFLVPVLFTFYIQGVLKKLKTFGAKRLTEEGNQKFTTCMTIRIKTYAGLLVFVYSPRNIPQFTLRVGLTFQSQVVAGLSGRAV